MPDEPRPQSNAVQIISLVLNFLQTIALAWMGGQLHSTDNKVGQGLQVQQEVKQETADSAKEIKTTLDTRANKIDAEAERQKKATSAILYGNWVYLRDNGYTEEAANAKKRYDEFNGKK